MNTQAQGFNLEAFQVFEDHREEILAAESLIEVSGFAMFKVIVRETDGDNSNVTAQKAFVFLQHASNGVLRERLCVRQAAMRQKRARTIR